MKNISQRLSEARKKVGITQNEVAEKLNVSFQAVSSWERGETCPDIDKISDIASIYHVSIDWLLGKDRVNKDSKIFDNMSSKLFNEKKMYTYIKTYAASKNMKQTLAALPYAREKHEGQFRKGPEIIPYIYHPMLMACHIISMGIDDDDMIATALLHDVCEDCGVAPSELPVNDNVKEAVRLLTKDENYSGSDEDKKRYYTDIAENPIASMVKILDRCNNVSGMAEGFPPEKIVKYIEETEEWFYPLIRNTKEKYPMYSNQLFLLKYQMVSTIVAIKHLL